MSLFWGFGGCNMMIINHLHLLLEVKRGWSFTSTRRPRIMAVVLILCLLHANSNTLAFILDTMELEICFAKNRKLASNA
jgi:hypothetical protein